MKRNNILLIALLVLLTAVSVPVLSACSSSGTATTTTTTTATTTQTSPTGSGGAVIQSDSSITGEIKSIRREQSGYPYELDVLVLSSNGVDNLTNPTIDEVGKVITAKTDEDVSSFQAEETITARVKYVGDVPLPGISLYIYNIEALTALKTEQLGQEFTLDIGQSATIQGEGLTIKFIDVTSDSRCPQGATCIWAGEVNCLVQVTQPGLPASKITLTQSGKNESNATQDIEGYSVMFRVDPYPVLGKQIVMNEYRLVVTIEKNAQPGVEISPAPIHDAKIAVTLAEPYEVWVYIKGGLSTTCASFHGITTERTGDTIDINVTVQTVTGQFCGQLYTFFEKYVNLGSDFVSGRDYTVNINGETTTFTMP